jgi:hypothetical protein
MTLTGKNVVRKRAPRWVAGLALGSVLVASAVIGWRNGTEEPAETLVLTLSATLENAPQGADFGAEPASDAARLVANRVVITHDNGGLGFIVIDKKNARLHVFDAQAVLRGSSPVLLGSALGDDSVEGIGTRPINQVRPQERTTPAGRFMAERGHNTNGEDIVWVDYDAAVSMHRVRTHDDSEQRLQRMATSAVDDNRISYGCINIPAVFYDAHVKSLFATRQAMVYVLPDVKDLRQVFGALMTHAAPSEARGG